MWEAVFAVLRGRGASGHWRRLRILVVPLEAQVDPPPEPVRPVEAVVVFSSAARAGLRSHRKVAAVVVVRLHGGLVVQAATAAMMG